MIKFKLEEIINYDTGETLGIEFAIGDNKYFVCQDNPRFTYGSFPVILDRKGDKIKACSMLIWETP